MSALSALSALAGLLDQPSHVTTRAHIIAVGQMNRVTPCPRADHPWCCGLAPYMGKQKELKKRPAFVRCLSLADCVCSPATFLWGASVFVFVEHFGEQLVHSEGWPQTSMSKTLVSFHHGWGGQAGVCHKGPLIGRQKQTRRKPTITQVFMAPPTCAMLRESMWRRPRLPAQCQGRRQLRRAEGPSNHWKAAMRWSCAFFCF